MEVAMEVAMTFFVYDFGCGNDDVATHIYEAVEYHDEDLYDKDDAVVIHFNTVIEYLRKVGSVTWNDVVFTLVDNEDFELRLI